MIRKILLKLYYKPPVYFVNHYRICRLKTKSRAVFKKYLGQEGEKKLHVGCGSNIIESWLNTDIQTQDSRIAYLDAGRAFPLPDSAFDYVYSEHIFEHLTFSQGLNMLKECFRVLKPGGHVRLATPDIDFLMGLYNEPEKEIHKKYVKWSTNRFMPEISNTLQENEYSAAFVVNNFFHDWGHKVLYNFEGLELILKKTGFSNIIRQEVGKSDVLVYKQLEKHGEIIPKEFNELETIVVEAIKRN
jgi:predicted SAM-dependent methyltransferase